MLRKDVLGSVPAWYFERALSKEAKRSAVLNDTTPESKRNYEDQDDYRTCEFCGESETNCRCFDDEED